MDISPTASMTIEGSSTASMTIEGSSTASMRIEGRHTAPAQLMNTYSYVPIQLVKGSHSAPAELTIIPPFAPAELVGTPSFAAASLIDTSSTSFIRVEGTHTAPAELGVTYSSEPIQLIQSKNTAPANLQFETIKSLQATDLSDGISLSSYNTTGGFSRLPSPNAEFCVDKFSEEFFIFRQVTCAVAESKKYYGSMDQIATAFHKGFQFLESNPNLTVKDQLLALSLFSAQNPEIIIILPNGDELNITPYVIELFSAYRKNFYNTPGGHGLALRSGLNALSTINWVGSLNLPDSSIPGIIKFSNTFFYKQIMALAGTGRPNQ